MPNNTISQVEVNGTTYDLLDMNTLSAVSALNTRVTTLESSEMSVDVRGGAKLEEHGGLALRDGALGIGSLVQESDGAVRGSIAGLTAEGHAEQFSTTGKNLLHNTATSRIANGVTFTVNPDGSVTANGTATADANLLIGDVQVSVGSTYTGSGCSGGNRTTFMLNYDERLNGQWKVDHMCTTAPISFSPTYDVVRCFLIVKKDTIVSNLTFYPQLELGSTATEYEPYTGGAPSPSPDYPQEIQVVRGRNLLDESALILNAFVNLNGVQETLNGWACTDYLPIIPSMTYTLVNPNMENSGKFAILFYDSSKVFVDRALGNISGTAQFTTPANAKYARVNVNNSSVGQSVLQLTLGSTPQPYVPYGHVGLEVQGKNLLRNAATSKTTNGVTFTVNADGSVTVNGTASANAYFDMNIKYHIDAGSYYLSDGVQNRPNNGTLIYVNATDVNRARKYSIATTANNPQLTVSSNAYDLDDFTFGIQIPVNTTCNNLTFYPQLELGSTATPYEPYHHTTTPVPLPSRGWVGSLPDDTADVLTLDGAGKVEWSKATSEVVLDGDETWSYNPNDSATWIYTLISDSRRNEGYSANAVDMYVSHGIDVRTPIGGGTGVDPDAQVANAGKCWRNYGTQFHFIPPTSIGTDWTNSGRVIQWKALLSSNPVTVLYPLATPVIEECGYINMPSIEGDCTISIPELDALGVKYFVDDSAGTLARQWYDREVNESDESLAQSIAMIESTTARSNHAVNSYFMLDNVLRKATSAIASGETITDSNSSPITVEQVVTTLNNSVVALEKEVVFAITPSVSHRNIYRGKNLGTTLTTAQKAQIAAGTFDDLYVGDYWTINGRVYRIADINYYYNSGDTAFTKNHLVIVPDASFGGDKMNDTNTTTGAYKGSKMYTDASSVLNTARTTIANDFGSALATHRIYLQNATTNGYASSGEWTDSTVDLMNEPMVYGSYIYTPAGDGSKIVNRYTVEKSQLALFRLNHRMINPSRYWYWLRDVVSGANFALADAGGFAAYHHASVSSGVRPDFCIVGD